MTDDESTRAVVPLTVPRDGVPDPLTTPDAFADAIARLAAGEGPVAVDAERASGYRYGQRAYLVQLRRAGAGTILIDPVSLPDLSELGAALEPAEWVLHAASQDLPCLAEVGMRPRRLFDTELAGRLLGYPKVGLGAMVSEQLGYALEKGHSAADWSTRPLPRSWLAYAALDVEVLIELRDLLEKELAEQGKLEWARQEFAAIVASPPPPPRAEPWRRTSGIHRVRGRRQLAAVRSLWESRDALARERDLAPGRVLPDSAIVDAAMSGPRTQEDLVALPIFGGRQHRRLAARWYAALTAARTLVDAELPMSAIASDAPPPTNRWADRDPDAAARLAAARAAIGELSDRHVLPVENLLAPDLVRRLAWQPPAEPGGVAVAAALVAGGARRWQVELTAEPLAEALAARAAEPDDPDAPRPARPGRPPRAVRGQADATDATAAS
ncbi:MAG TPA: HRDC domain-containing protein [Mycobacteriales bacterium]|nr:HRDC domain-containing protein [Mycobacteriales bacterium]